MDMTIEWVDRDGFERTADLSGESNHPSATAIQAARQVIASIARVGLAPDDIQASIIVPGGVSLLLVSLLLRTALTN